MMPRRLIVACLCLVALAGAAASTGAQPAAPAFELQGPVAGATSSKYPHIAVAGPGVYLAANTGRADAALWSKGDTDAAFGAAAALGPAEGQPDYSTASVAVGPGGALAYAWVNQPARTVFLRTRQPGGQWGPALTVASGQAFPVHPEVAVGGDGALVVVWRNPDRPFVYRRSADGGHTWGGIAPLAERAGVGAASLAVGPGGSVAAAYTAGEADRLQVYLARWSGAALRVARLTRLGGDYADPSLAYAPDGRLYVAWRGVAQSGGAAGVFFAEGQPDGSFPPARLVAGRVAGRVSLSADGAGNLHLLWTAAAGDGYQLWYAARPAGGAWTQPVAAPAAGGTIFNAYGAGAIGTGGAAYAHAASEVFYGTSVGLRHYRFRAGLTGAAAVGARPVLEGGAARSRGGELALGFADVVGAPSEVRLRWGAAPTDADPWRPYAATVRVPAPALADPGRCADLALFAQVRSGGAYGQPLSDTITLDVAVQARAVPYHPGAAPGYTDEPALDVVVEDEGECSGLATAREWPDGAPAAALGGGAPQLTLALPDEEGRHERAVELADGLGNTRVVTVGVVYDRTDPTGAYAEPLAVVPDPRATVLQTLVLTGAAYGDGGAGAELPWAAAVAVARGPVDPGEPGLRWALVPLAPGRVARAAGGAPGAPLAAEVAVNLAELLPRAQLTPGAYHYALALVDPAGNRTAAVATGRVDLAEVTFPAVYLPGVAR